MAFEGPLPSQLSYNREGIPSPAVGDDEHLSGDQSAGPLTSTLASQRRRSSTKAAMPSVVKRSASSPNVRDLSTAESTSNSTMADKRRNKLGYHRTSVACGHCRRRKIRCLVAPDDAQGRCSNCIRLKKECNFFPVDQQPPSERRPRSASKGDTLSNDTSASSSSSPALAGGHVVEQVENFHQYPALAMHGMPDDGNFNPPYGAPGFSPGARGPLSSRSFERPTTFDHQVPWENSPFLEQSPASAGDRLDSDDPSGRFWRDSPTTPAYSQFSFPSSTMSHHGPPYHNPSDGHAWSNPGPRSMSMVNVEDLPSQYQDHHYSQAFLPDFKRRMTTSADACPPSLDTSNNSSNLSVAEPQSTPISHTMGVQSMPHFTYAPGWSNFVAPQTSTGLMKGQESLGGWYSGGPHLSNLAEVREEDTALPFSGDPFLSQPESHRYG